MSNHHPDTLVIATNSDMDSPTVVAVLQGGNTEHYTLPSRLIPPLLQALSALDQGDQDPLREYCLLFQCWFDERYPPPQSLLLSICDYEREVCVKFFHNNQEKLSFLEITSLNAPYATHHTIPIEEFAKVLLQQDLLDEGADQFFGELGWQKVRRWME